MTSPASQTGPWALARAEEGLDKVWCVDARWWDLSQGCRMWYVGEAQSPGGSGEQGWPHHQSYGADGRDSKWRDTVTADKVEAGRRETVSRRVLSPWGYEDCSSRWPVFFPLDVRPKLLKGWDDGFFTCLPNAWVISETWHTGGGGRCLMNECSIELMDINRVSSVATKSNQPEF